MMKTRLFSLVSAVVATTLSVLSAGAADVTPEQASLAAQRWVARSGEFAASFGKTVETVAKETVQGTSFYVAKMQGGGVIVLSADTTQRPVIFALSGTEFQVVEQNPAVKLLVADLKRTPSEKSAEANETAWRKLVSTGPSLMATSPSAPSDLRVDGLVTTHWNQNFDLSNNFCYDYYTPPIWKDGIEGGTQVRSCDVMAGNYTTGNSTHTPAGCAPVAAAQIMNYFEYPAAYPNYTRQGMWLENTNDHYEDITLVNAGQVIPWNLMLDEPGKNGVTTTDANRQAIGALCFNVGLAGACNIYGWAGSSGGDIGAAFRVFGYSNAEGFGGDAATLQRIIRANLNAKRPLFINIPGHAIVCDGYGYSGGDLYVRLNYGWSMSDHLWYSQGAEDADPVIEGGVGNIYTTEPTSSVILSGRVTGSAATVTAVDAADPSKSYTGKTDAKGVYALLVPPGKYLTYIKVADSYSSAKAVSMAAGIAGDIDNCDFVASAADKASAPEVLGVPTGYTQVDCVKNVGTAAVTVGGQTIAPGQKVTETLAITDANGTVTAALIPVRRASDGASGFVDTLSGTFSTDAALISRLPGEGFALPSIYTALEYIASTGEQYINTRYVLQAADKIECVVNVPQEQLVNPNVALYGTSYSWAYGCRTFLVKQNGNAVCSYDIVPWEGSYGNYVSGEGFYGRKVSIADVNGQLTWTALDDSGCSGSAASLYGNPSAAFNSLLIFDHNVIAGYNDAVSNAGQDGYWASAVAKLYSFTITDANGNKVRDYIPCKNAGGTVGLWDKAEGDFVTSATSVAFPPSLPAGYEEVEFIRSGNNQYINTGHCPTDKTRIVATVYEPEQTGAGGISHGQDCDFAAMFGSFTNGGPDTHDESWVFSAYNCCAYFLKWWSNAGGQDYMRYKPNQCSTDGIQAGYGNLPAHNTKRTYEFHPTGFRIDGGDWGFWNGVAWINAFDVPPVFTSAYPLYIFGANQDGTFKYPASMRLYGFKIYEDDVLVRDFVPCRNEKGEAGLYDFVGEQFYGNANTAIGAEPFCTTAENVLPEGYKQVDYIGSDGTQYLDTGIVPDATTVIDMNFSEVKNTSTFNVLFSAGGFADHACAFVARQVEESWGWGADDRCRFTYWGNYNLFEFGIPGYGNVPAGSTDVFNFHLDLPQAKASMRNVTQNGVSAEIDVDAGLNNVTGPISIFCQLNRFNDSPVAFKLHSFKIWKNGSLVLDLVPCRKPDGTVGLWDKAGGRFITSPVGNAFVAPYALPGDYTALDYIESTPGGNQYINTGYPHQFLTRVVCDMWASQQVVSTGNLDDMSHHAVFGAHKKVEPGAQYINFAYNFYLSCGTATATVFTRNANEHGRANDGNNFPFGTRVMINCDLIDGFAKAQVGPNGPTYDSLLDWNAVPWDWGRCPLYVFAADETTNDDLSLVDVPGTPTQFTVMRLYGFKIYEGGELKRDYVPCRNPDGVAGLFDRVYGKFYSSPNGVPFVGSDEIVYRSWVRTDGNLYIDTGYVPQANTKVDCVINFDLAANADRSHAAVFGATAVDGYDACTFFRWNRNNNPLYVRGGGENSKVGSQYFYDRKVNLVCDGTSAAWTVLEGADAGQSESVTYVQGTPGAVKPGRNLYIFGFNENNAMPGGHITSVMTFYTFGISEGTTVKRRLFAAMDVNGRVAGVVDALTGDFLPFSGSGTPTFGGLAYQLKDNVMLLRSGTMESGDADGYGAMTYSAFEKITSDSVNAATLPATIPALAVREGELSFADEATKTYSVTGALTLEGGATLALEANLGTGAVDAFTVGSLAVNATAENPVVVQVAALGGVQSVGRTPLTLISGGALAADDVAKFRLEGVNGELAVVDGNLVLRRAPGAHRQVMILVR